jgi:hypothetical protein
MTARQLPAAAFGLLTGLGGFALMLMAGWVLYQRLWPDSPVAMAIVIVLFGAAGGYAGWLLGLIVFAAVRGSGEHDRQA